MRPPYAPTRIRPPCTSQNAIFMHSGVAPASRGCPQGALMGGFHAVGEWSPFFRPAAWPGGLRESMTSEISSTPARAGARSGTSLLRTRPGRRGW